MTPYTRRFFAVTWLVLAGGLAACSDDPVGPDGSGNAEPSVITGVTQSRVLSPDTTYVLSGYVKVSNGATLTIPAGTTIVGDTLFPGSSLWILRGSRLVVNGTAAEPVVFTSQRAPGNRAPGDWGGIVIVGRAPINRTADPIFTEGPTGAAENYAGGTLPADDSGSIKYARIEFAGYDVSNGGGQELNSLSMYAVGSGTTIEYVQSMAGLDDSFETFGGSVNGRYLVSFESGDDHFDWTEGFQGRYQYIIGLQTSLLTPRSGSGTTSSDPRGLEGDGCENDKAGCTYGNQPHSLPVMANFTIIGPGTGVFSTNDGSGAVVRRGSGGYFVNGIIGRWPGVSLSIRDTESGNLLAANQMYFRGLIFADNGTAFEAPAAGRFGDQLNTNQVAWNIRTSTLAALFNTLPTSTTNVTAANVNMKPLAGSPAASGGLNSFTGTPLSTLVNNFFGGSMTATSYVGALDPAAATDWYAGWTNWVRN
jgi:hypothetical protein